MSHWLIMRGWRIAATALLIVLPAAASTAQELAPLSIGWERSFDLQWDTADRKGRAVIRGYVASRAGMPAANVRLLVEGVDASGQVVSQRVTWLGGELSPGARMYFEVPTPGSAVRYRVSVFAFDWLRAG